MSRRQLSPDARAVSAMLADQMADMHRAGVKPTPLSIVSAATDRTADDRMVRAVLVAAERQRVS